MAQDLFSLAQQFDPYGAYRESAMKAAAYDKQEKELNLKNLMLDQQQKEFKAEQEAPKDMGAGLQKMAGQVLPPTYDITKPVAGQMNQYKMSAIEDNNTYQKLMQQSKYILDPTEKTRVLGQAKLYQDRAMKYSKDAAELEQKERNNAIFSLVTAENKKQWDDTVEAWKNNGLPIPQGFSTEFSPENKDKLMRLAPLQVQTKIREELRKQEKEKFEKEERPYKLTKSIADAREAIDKPGNKEFKDAMDKYRAGLPLTPREASLLKLSDTETPTTATGGREFNVGNLRPSGFTYPGQTGVDKGGFAIFKAGPADDPYLYGRMALQQDIGAKLTSGYNTPQKFIERYAPPKSKGGDNPDATTAAYVNNVAKALGINPTDQIPNTPEARQILQNAIIKQEGVVSPTGAKVYERPTKSGVYERTKGEQIIGATQELKRSLNIVSNFPMTVSGGLFGQMKSKTGFFDAPLNVASVALTKEEQRNFNKSTSNIGNALAIIEAGGYKPNQAQIDRYNAMLQWNPEDTINTKLFSMADAKAQTVERANVVLANPNIPKELRDNLRQGLDDLNKIIPFEPEDVQAATQKGMSIKQYMKEKSGLVKSTLPDGWSVKVK